MARRFQGAGGDDEGGNEIDISPLIDCVFILLIFFIVTTVFVEEPGVDVNKTRTMTEQQLERESLLIAVTNDGGVFYGGQNVGVAGIGAIIRRQLSKDPDTPVIIQPDVNAPAGVFMRVLDEAKLADAKNVNVSTKGEDG